MKTFGYVIFAFLAAIFSDSSMASPLSRIEKVSEKSKVYIIPHMREKRSPEFTLEGRGSNKSGYIKPGYSGTIWENKKTKIEGSASLQENWQQHYGHHETYNLGGKVTHNLYDGPKGRLDVYAEYDKTLSGGMKSGYYRAGTNWRF